ncbi:hypothetical protein SNEBB_002866 [Seison nebaliae]|nr:hypothetical protein SNEBB_002866 [Seison nebaliae]
MANISPTTIETEKMKKFWQQHQPNMNSMLLINKNDSGIIEHDTEEILESLPTIKDMNILELGCGIGRFTACLANEAKHITAVDFVGSFLEENKKMNSSKDNIDYVEADVLNLDFPKESFDMIFSNWLFMYISDGDLEELMARILKWLKPNGKFVFRESCFHKSGDKSNETSDNPTHYRKPHQYTEIMERCNMKHDKENEYYVFEIRFQRSNQSYFALRKNSNQIYWLYEKKKGLPYKGFETFQSFLDNRQYETTSIIRYESVYGDGYISTGGEETTQQFITKYLDPFRKSFEERPLLLDVGCGVGGGDFLISKTLNIDIIGIDLSTNMIELAQDKLQKQSKENCSVRFEISDVMHRKFNNDCFDIIYSRDTFLHIADKKKMFEMFKNWMKSKSILVFSDYSCSDQEWSDEFKQYIDGRGYSLCSTNGYKRLLEEVGFVNVKVIDRTNDFLYYLKLERTRLMNNKEKFIDDWSEIEFTKIINNWDRKIDFVNRGDQRWVEAIATKL